MFLNEVKIMNANRIIWTLVFYDVLKLIILWFFTCAEEHLLLKLKYKNTLIGLRIIMLWFFTCAEECECNKLKFKNTLSMTFLEKSLEFNSF